MKITVTKEWFRSRAHLEEGHEIGAGSLQHIGQPALRSLSGNPSSGNAAADNIGFGQAVALMRRHRRWTIDRLAKEAEATSEELAAIERNPDFVPELSTVVSLATTFGIPPKAMIYKAGLARPLRPVCRRMAFATQPARNSKNRSPPTKSTFSKRCSRRLSNTRTLNEKPHPPAGHPAED